MCLFYSQVKSSFVSVVFDLSDSLNNADPVSPILLTVGYLHSTS